MDDALFATDFDGTLLDSTGEPVRRSADAFAAARRGGLAVVPVTARGPRSSLAIARTLHLGPVCVCSNGVLGLDVRTGDVIWRHGLPPGSVAEIISAVAREIPEARFAVETREQFLVEPAFFEPQWRRFAVATVVARRGLAAAEVLKVVVRAPHRRGDELQGQLRGVLGGLSLIPGSSDWLDIIAHGVSKGSGIGLGAEVLGVDLERVGAVGDHLNDVAMFHTVGRAYAVADGHPRALEAADEIVSACGDGGAGEALRRFVDTIDLPMSQRLPRRER
ncbi:HAD-superfamily hydrolase, subfamily IIB [Acidimicrobium ferrooxidans DSM 10331]|uniref:HAD-superfamily hydrolase, subfamily IIB n=1 Tax=Acidimicrobium ferrooxidans (strain DSM 10331 / JCM 15462 / NBRC 103882 / ICP) TaxID=525909 RepID=C7LXW1_ACIFD|nr:HAD family hydrolase [Acidimicrobium ferrooxidans]ACU53569.1 HAD-superfamily hydrolase, subfamily IIB [Acidimicrobium ferrooxidans DSM 10331]